MSAPAPAPGSEVQEEHRPNVRPIMAGVLLALLLASLDQTVVATAMPTVIATLHGFDRYAWVTTSYMLASTVTVPIYGKLSDIFGRKPIFLFGISVFLLGSALSGASQSMNQLIVFRGLQGFGAGAMMPIAFAIVGDLFPPKERGKIQGLTGGVWGMSSIIGPALGGWITDGPGWRWVFYVNIPLGVVTLAVLALLMPPLKHPGSDSKVDWLGALLLACGAVPLLLGFTWAGSTYAWGSPQIVGLLVGAAIMFAIFFLYESRVSQPIIEPRLFRNVIFADSVAITFLMGAGMFGAISYIPLFMQGVVGQSATGSGALLTPLMVTAIAGSIVSGQLMSHWGRYRKQAIFGLLVTVAGMLLLTQLTVHSRSSQVVVAMVVLGLGLGFGMSLYTIVVQNSAPRRQLGQVTSGLTFFRQIGGTMGIAVMGSFLTGHFAGGVRDNLPSTTRAALSPKLLSSLSDPQALLNVKAREALAARVSRLPNGAHLAGDLEAAMRAALANSLHQVYIVGLVVVGLALVAALFLKEIPLKGREHDAAQPEVAA